MTFAITSRIAAGSTAAASFTTASFTPTANSLLVCYVHNENQTDTTAPSWTIADTQSLTWTPQAESTHPGGTYAGTGKVWTAPVGASPASMTITVDVGIATSDYYAVRVVDVTGHNVAAPVVQAKAAVSGANSGTPSDTKAVTLVLDATPGASNLVLGFYGTIDNSGNPTLPSGYAAVTGNENPARAYAFSDDASASATLSTSDMGTGVYWGTAVGIEIALDPTPKYRSHSYALSSTVGTEPTGAALDDILVMNCYCEVSTTITPPTGWSDVFGSDTIPTAVLTADGVDWSTAWFWIRRGGSAPSYTTGGMAGFSEVMVVAYTGAVDTGNPFSFATAAERDDLTAQTYPAVSGTTNQANELLVWFGESVAGAISTTFPSGFTARESTDGRDMQLADKAQSAAGATGSYPATGGLNANGNTAAFLAGLSPTTVSGGGTTYYETPSGAVTPAGALTMTKISSSALAGSVAPSGSIALKKTSYVVPTVVNARTGTASAAPTTGVVVTKPPDIANGDVLYAFVSKTTYANTAQFTCSGWTEVSSGTRGTTTGNDRHANVLRKVITDAANEPATYTFVTTSGTTSTMVGTIIAVRGANTTTPEDITVGAPTAVSNDSTPASLNKTSVTPQALAIQYAQLSLATVALRTWGVPSGYTGDAGNADGGITANSLNNQQGVAWKSLGAAGSTTGTNSWTATASEATAESYTYAVLVRPKTTITEYAFPTGRITPAGAVTLEETEGGNAITPTGTVTPAGAVVRVVGKALVGTITPTGVIAKRPAKALVGSVTPSGVKSLASLRSLVGTITPAGTLAKSAAKGLTGALQPAGTLAKGHTGRILTGAVSSIVGSIGKQPRPTKTAALTPSQVMARAVSKPGSGTIGPDGAGAHRTALGVGGTTAPAATLGRAGSFARALAGSIGSSATVVVTRVLVRAFTGTITPSAALSTIKGKFFASSVTPASTQSHAVTAVKTGTVTPVSAGRFAAAVQFVKLATIVATGTAAKAANRPGAGSVTPGGADSLRTSYAKSGSVTLSGAAAKRQAKSATGSIAPAGVVRKFVARLLAGSIGLAGSVSTIALQAINLAGSIYPAATVARLVRLVKTGSVDPAGSETASVAKALAGTAPAVGTVAKASASSLVGAVGLAGLVRKLVGKLLAGLLTPTGTYTDLVIDISNDELFTHPVTLTINDKGHTVSKYDQLHQTTIIDSWHTVTCVEQQPR